MVQKRVLVLVEKTREKAERRLVLTTDKDFRLNEPARQQRHTLNLQSIKHFLTKVFMPAGYPHSVTPDYLRYQILNALQAFCSSLASLLTSRAVLEGMGVGNSSASSTHAMLLSTLQDAFGRIATIVGAYYIGTSLVPEAKTYRFLADILNDLAVITDTFSHLLNAYLFPGAWVIGLCTSAALKALCGIAAGGSKAAITLHFATPTTGSGDMGDLSAKDSSKETVLALVGMLLGTLIVPRITSPFATYALLSVLVIAHLTINYTAVQGLGLRNLNKQRATIVWLRFKSGNGNVLSPQEVTKYELILEVPGILRDPDTRRVFGECHIGSAPLDVMRGPSLSTDFLGIFSAERYIVCFDASKPLTRKRLNDPNYYPSIHVCFKEGFTFDDQLKGWFHAVEVCRALMLKKTLASKDSDAGEEDLVRVAYGEVEKYYEAFRDKLKTVGWNVAEHHLMSGHGPKAVLCGASET